MRPRINYDYRRRVMCYNNTARRTTTVTQTLLRCIMPIVVTAAVRCESVTAWGGGSSYGYVSDTRVGGGGGGTQGARRRLERTHTSPGPGPRPSRRRRQHRYVVPVTTTAAANRRKKPAAPLGSDRPHFPTWVFRYHLGASNLFVFVGRTRKSNIIRYAQRIRVTIFCLTK